MYKKLYLFNVIAEILRMVSVVMFAFLLSQIIKNYNNHAKYNVKNSEIQLDLMINSYGQINAKENNLYIESDSINIGDSEILLNNNTIKSDSGNGKNKVMIYNKVTGDIIIQGRPVFVFD
jgi:hypothetical protein